MSNLQAAVRAFATDTTEPAELCQQVNRILCGHIAEGRFISFFYCIIDNDESTLTFANAGHYPPILIRADGSRRAAGTGGPVLGVFPEGGYEQGRVALRSGNRIVLYTDGITDVCNAADEEFGDERLVDLAVANRACSAPALQARLADAPSTPSRMADFRTMRRSSSWRPNKFSIRRCSSDETAISGTKRIYRCDERRKQPSKRVGRPFRRCNSSLDESRNGSDSC